METQDIDTCLRCGGYVETINEQPGARCPHCGVRLDVTHSITFDEQEEALALGFDINSTWIRRGECAEIVDGCWCIVGRDGEAERCVWHVSANLDRLLGFIYRTATVANPEGRRF